MTPARARLPWWRDAVCYEVYVRSFADGDGDGLGDLAGVRSRLPYLADLGVDALWLTPFYPSPMADGGYDVADPRGVDRRFGDLAGFDALLADAHALGLKVTVDVVPNHSSDQHPWFQAALAAGPGSPERARYLFRDGRGRTGAEPPNNWRSTFGGPAWTRVPDGQWYLHLFAPEQPDWDWRHPDVRADHERTLRFWLDRGVDGFRVDVAHGLVKAADLPDNPPGPAPDLLADDWVVTGMWNQPEVHEVYRCWRAVLDSYPGDRMAVGEVWLGDPHEVARYVRPDELHLAFNLKLLQADWYAAELRREIDRSLDELAKVGAPTTWVLSNHDVTRHLTRFGGGERGRRRARAAALLLLALPGPAYLYQGEELGLPEVEDLPVDVLADPIWQRSGHTERGRDGCRVPLPWTAEPPAYGFTTGRPWLPMPPRWAGFAAERQAADPGSMLALYRAALALRRRLREPARPTRPAAEPLAWLDAGPDVLAFRRDDGLVCVVNAGSTPAIPPVPGSPELASGPLGPGGALPPDTAAWWCPVLG